MNSRRTIETFFRMAVVRYAGVGLTLSFLLLFAASFLLARQQAVTGLQENARGMAQAFHDRIIDGDIRSVETQMALALSLKAGEVVKILKADHTPVYTQIGSTLEVKNCTDVGTPCFDGYFGKARIEYPITMDSKSSEPFRYLYLSKDVSLNWSFLLTVFTVFILCYATLIVFFLRVSKVASIRIGDELKNWSARIQENPKDASPRAAAPFDELRPLKDALAGLNQQIENFEKTATDKAKLLLLRGIAHDLLTPVSQLQLNLATLKARLQSEEHAELLLDITASLRRVSGIAAQVKSLSAASPVESSDLVKEISSEVKALAESELVTSKKIHLDFKSQHESLPSPFSKTEVSRILANLVQNAVDASANGSKIEVSISSQERIAVLTVKDSGKGITKSAQPKVFDPEFTLKPSTGTGLGLAVVKYICDSRAARIDLSSELNRGTTISIQFPMSEVPYV